MVLTQGMVFRSLRQLRRGTYRPLSVATAAEATELPYAPGKLPFVGHGLTRGYKPNEFCAFLEANARDIDKWSFKLQFPLRTAAIVGNPAMAAALLKTNSGWTHRGVEPEHRQSATCAWEGAQGKLAPRHVHV